MKIISIVSFLVFSFNLAVSQNTKPSPLPPVRSTDPVGVTKAQPVVVKIPIKPSGSKINSAKPVGIGVAVLPPVTTSVGVDTKKPVVDGKVPIKNQ